MVLTLCLLRQTPRALAFHASRPHRWKIRQHGSKMARFYRTAALPPFEELPPEVSGNKFQVTSPYEPTGDQPQAIDALVKQVQRGDKYSVLRGCTGTGKTMVMAHTIAKIGKPTLVLCHNKTLAAQLARELKSCLKHNHVQLFVR